MSFFDLLNHLANFVAPAFFMALVMALAGRWLFRKNAGTPGFLAQFAIDFVAGALVLLAGLAYYGRDGKMLTYASLVVVCATVQWLVMRGFRR